MLYCVTVVSEANEAADAGRQPGSQTLWRGLRALEFICESPRGVSIQQVADELGVHRTIAYRLLLTLADVRFAFRDVNGRFFPGARLASLAGGVHTSMREAALPAMRDLADALGTTVSLLVRETVDAVAIAVVAPARAGYHIAFREGSRHPLHVGSAGLVLLSLEAPDPGEPPRVAEVRKQGFARTYAEVEPGAYGLAVPIPEHPDGVHACLNLISHREDVFDGALEQVQAAAKLIAATWS